MAFKGAIEVDTQKCKGCSVCIEAALAGQFHGLLAVKTGLHLVTFPLQIELDPFHDDGFVIHH